MDPEFQARVQRLGDLELALLLCLVAQEHCIITTNSHTTLDALEDVQLSCVRTFSLRAAVVNCTSTASVDDFNEDILIEQDDDADDVDGWRNSTPRAEDRIVLPSFGSPGTSRLGSIGNTLDQRRIADVIIARGLDCASEDVQVQALELIRTGRIFSRSSMHVAPKDLLFIVILSRPGARLSHHLHDLFSMSFVHDADGLPAGDESVVSKERLPIQANDIKHLREDLAEIEIIAEMAEYVHNIEVFLRNSRYVKGGVTATATRNLRTLSRALALLHNLDYIPPSLVVMAAHKVYAHRLVLATAENEKSLLWGSDPEAIQELLQGLTPEDVIEEVISGIEAPL